MRRLAVILTTGLLAGCLGTGLPEAQQLTLAAPSGMKLPVQGRALLIVAESDLKRLFSYKLNPITVQKTEIKEGEALERSARTLLLKAFSVAATNDASVRPHVIARLSGKTVYDRTDNTYKVSCGIDAYDAVGFPIGNYLNNYKSPPMLGVESALGEVYGQCLKAPVQQLMASSAIGKMNQAGFPEPDREKSDGYLRSQGFVIR